MAIYPPAQWPSSIDSYSSLAMLDTHPGLMIAFTTIAGGTPGTRHT